METKYVKVHFDLELAKKITNGEVEGRIVTRDGRSTRIVCYDMDNGGNKENSILALVKNQKGEFTWTYNSAGCYCNGSKSNLDLMLEIPEYMTFKDGDVLYARTNKFWYVFIYINNGKDKTYCCAALDEEDMLWIEDNRITSNDDISELRFATEPEKQKLIEALKASEEPKAKECLKMLGIAIKPECKFQPFDKVLVRDYDDGVWKADIFLNNSDGCNYMCTGNVVWAQCIPYNEQTAHLLGTTDNWEDKQ